MTTRTKLLRKFCEERDAVLRTLDAEQYARFRKRWKMPEPGQWVKPDVPYAVMHKARLGVRAFTKDEKLLSARWLTEHGYQLPAHIRLEGDELIGAEYDH